MVATAAHTLCHASHERMRVLVLQVPLTDLGWHQAVACGHQIREIMEAEYGQNYKLFYMTSPYCRSRQTYVGIRQAFHDRNFAGLQVQRCRHSQY